MQRGTSVLPKSTSAQRIVSNLAVLDWRLSDEDMAALSQLDYQARMVDGKFLLSPAGPYRSVRQNLYCVVRGAATGWCTEALTRCHGHAGPYRTSGTKTIRLCQATLRVCAASDRNSA